MSTAVKLAPAIVTKDELTELADAERAHASAKKKAAAAERDVKIRRLGLAEKVLGIKTEDELKALSPQQLEKKIARRLEVGDWKPDPKAPEFSFVETRSARYPAWKEIFAQKFGQSEADRISDETPLSHSYRVEVA
jgi:hypothetical protein